MASNNFCLPLTVSRAVMWLVAIFTALTLGACDRSNTPVLPIPANPQEPAAPSTPPAPPISQSPAEIDICTFNIQFLGSSKVRDDVALATMLKDQGCDLVAVQEVVAPPDFRQLKGSPYFGALDMPTYPNGAAMVASDAVTEFFLAMEGAGFDGFVMSPEQTGASAVVNNNSTAGEWFVTFFRRDVVEPADDLFTGFISAPTAKNPEFDRVPYAFGFRAKQVPFDFVIVSVHLHPGPSKKDRERRAVEFDAIFRWISQQRQNGPEQDYIVIGDANVEDAKELASIEALTTLKSMNTGALIMTNTNPKSPKPYDHCFIDYSVTSEIPFDANFTVLNLIDLMRPHWAAEAPYPGDQYNHTLFRMYFSDHHPVRITARPPMVDDD